MSLLGGAGSLTGDIWSTGAFSFESPLKDLLDSKDYTLEQLLAEDELLQELRGLHPTLIEYFSQEQTMTKLIRYITLPHRDAHSHNVRSETTRGEEYVENEPIDRSLDEAENEDSRRTDSGAERVTRQLEKRKLGRKTSTPESDPEFRHIRFPYMACEIICCEIDSIINTLVDGYVKEDGFLKDEDNPSDAKPSSLLDIFFNVLYDTPPGQLDDYRAGYFDKILSILFRKRSQDISNYINNGGDRGQENLMEAMMKHLYSYSIMQICQRLLLPPRPTPKQGEEGGQTTGEQTGEQIPTIDLTEADDGDIGGQDILSGEDDEDNNGNGIKCDWSKSGKPIEMLLERLICPDSLLEIDAQVSPASAVDTIQSIEEQRLSLSLNASEVLITVIQNSMLSSETMLSLTSLEIMQRLAIAATKLEPGESFSSHESLLTSAMNVVESLVLQLGGYGAVGTMSILDQNETQGTGEIHDKNGEGTQPSFIDKDHLIADLESLLQVLPSLLQGFSKLLRHTSTKEWTSSVQFSRSEPIQMLGTSRLRIVRVLESLVLLGDPSVDNKLVQSDCLLICLDLFWEFQWCSMLHQSVANLLVHVFEGQNSRFEIQEYFICKCNLIGRLMNSFVEVTDPRFRNTLVFGLDAEESEPKSSDNKEDATDALPVSEDDIDAALEKQEDELESKEEGNASSAIDNDDLVSTGAVDEDPREFSNAGVNTPAQSFRFGYMGHVIIICQALVQACAGNEWSTEQGGSMVAQQQGKEVYEPAATSDVNIDQKDKADAAANEPLMIAELVNNHKLTERWQDFVIGTLASEIAVQSTPLGGLNAQPTDPLQTHRPDGPGRRPGLADEGELGDDTIAPPVPRGMLGANEVGDMDSDMDVAASMINDLNFSVRSPDDDKSRGSEGEFSGSGDSGDSQKTYNSGETANSNEGYIFDDPLGKAGGTLGIELGKLTQYHPEEDKNKTSGGEESYSIKDNSFDEEPQKNEEDHDEDPPVMDLFAGNFSDTPQPTQGEENPEAPSTDSAAFEFANFENAFEGDGAEVFGDFESAAGATGADSTEKEIGDIFGGSSSLLDELDDLPPPAHDQIASDTAEKIPEDHASYDTLVKEVPFQGDAPLVQGGGVEPEKAMPANSHDTTTPSPETATVAEESAQKDGVLVS